MIGGGPGTGKTTTVARIVALLVEQALAAGSPPPLIGLAAPTGKAAARLEEAVHGEAAGLAVADEVRAQLAELQAVDAAPAARAGARAATAASATTAASGCRTTS